MEEQKVFTLDDEDYYAAHSLMEFLNWYNENVEVLEEPKQLQGLSMHNPEDACLWDSESVTEEDMAEYEKAMQTNGQCPENLSYIGGILYKKYKYSELIDEDSKEPYLISTQNDC